MASESIAAGAFSASMIGMGKCYLLMGTDAWLIDSVIDPIRAKLKKDFGVDLVTVYGDEVKAAQLNDVLDTLSIFSTQKLVILRNAEALRTAEQKVLANYVSSSSSTQSLIIVAAKADFRLSTWKQVRQGSLEITCDPPRGAWQLKQWLEGILHKTGIQMESGAQDLFLARIELDYANAFSELQKLSLLAGKGKRIGIADVERSVRTSRVGTMADFYRALGRRDLKSTLATVERMLDSEWEPLQIFFQFTKFYGLIHKILSLKKGHLSPAEISAKHLPELFQDQRKEFLSFSEKYSLASFREIFAILLETDSGLKLSQASGITLLELCAIRIMACR